MVNSAMCKTLCLYNFAVHPLRRRFAVAKDEWSGAYFLSVVSNMWQLQRLMTSFVRKDSNFRPLIQQKAAWENPRSRLQILGQSFFNMNTLKGLFVQSAGFQLLFQMVRGPVDWGRWWLVVVGCEKSQLYAAYGKIGKISCWNGGTHCTPKSSKRLDHLFFFVLKQSWWLGDPPWL